MENTEFDILYSQLSPTLKDGLDFAIKILAATEKEKEKS